MLSESHFYIGLCSCFIFYFIFSTYAMVTQYFKYFQTYIYLIVQLNTSGAIYLIVPITYKILTFLWHILPVKNIRFLGKSSKRMLLGLISRYTIIEVHPWYASILVYEECLLQFGTLCPNLNYIYHHKIHFWYDLIN